ncbi:MAG: hypothetical protein V3W41_14180 [Planctomycetota bacterium]
MKSLAAVLFALLLVFAVGFACRGGPTSDQHVTSPERVLVGQVLLPNGTGSRGVEIRATVAATDSEPRVVWVLFDEQGHFALPFRGSLTKVSVTAGPGAEVHRIVADEFPQDSRAGQIDLGVIDLRDRLKKHRIVVRAASGKPAGDIRVAMWSSPPPLGPGGGPVSLGSRQFPTVALGDEQEWLLPSNVQSIYFLVERPSGPERGRKWRSGHQRLFGPFSSAKVPTELIMD